LIDEAVLLHYAIPRNE